MFANVSVDFWTVQQPGEQKCLFVRHYSCHHRQAGLSLHSVGGMKFIEGLMPPSVITLDHDRCGVRRAGGSSQPCAMLHVDTALFYVQYVMPNHMVNSGLHSKKQYSNRELYTWIMTYEETDFQWMLAGKKWRMVMIGAPAWYLQPVFIKLTHNNQIQKYSYNCKIVLTLLWYGLQIELIHIIR